VTSIGLASLGWWLGFWIGPFGGLISYLSSGSDALARAHGRAAIVYWTISLAIWGAIAIPTILYGGSATPLIIGAGTLGGVSVLVCTIGTIQAQRGRSLLGQPIGHLEPDL
jgi:hypothetical protein